MTSSELLLIPSAISTVCLLVLVILALRGKMTGPQGKPGVDGPASSAPAAPPPPAQDIAEMVTWPGLERIGFVREGSETHQYAIATPGRAIRKNGEVILGNQ